ncbi:MAG TPA: pitrilysin family protein [Bellilinea sp.]|nr:pitrilysin family protein [Bellilinea sp.]
MTAANRTAHHSLPGPEDISRTVLPNGIVLLVRTNQISPSVSFSGYLQAGSVFDPREKLGLSSFTSAGLMRGTASRTFQQIYDDLETVGASLGFSSSTHTVGIGGRSLAEDLPMMLRLLAECLQQPVFPSEQVERLRAQALTSFAIRAQDTAEMASLTFDEILFAGHPYALPEDGYKETILAIQAADLPAFHQQHYGPRGMVLSIAGAVTAEQALDLVNQTLGSWTNPRQPAVPDLPPVLPLIQPVRRHIFIPGKTQADLILGGLGPKRKDADFQAASIGNHILGQFGMMGRIGDIVREKSGLAYSASTSLNAGISAGSWEFSAGVNPENVEKVIQLMLAEVERFTTEPVSQEELQDTKSAYIGSLPLGLESNAGVSRSILNIERYQLGLDYLLTYANRIEKITADMILECAQRYLNPDHFVTISAGPNPIEV